MRKLLEFLEFNEEQISSVLRTEEIYGEAVANLADRYMREGVRSMEPYPEGGREQALTRAIQITEQVAALDQEGKSGRRLKLLFWLHCVPYVRELYRRDNIPEGIFYDTMMDVTFKMRECEQVYGECGIFTPWVFLVFELKVFALGRLQFEITTAQHDIPLENGEILAKGTWVCSCHIPASGKLEISRCMDAFDQACEFFGQGLYNGRLPIVCDSWMLYPPYVNDVFPDNSGLQGFAGLFRVYDTLSTGQDFQDGWRIFGVPYAGVVQGLSDRTTLQKNFIRYIQNGGDFGYGFGVRMHKSEVTVNRICADRNP